MYTVPQRSRCKERVSAYQISASSLSCAGVLVGLAELSASCLSMFMADTDPRLRLDLRMRCSLISRRKKLLTMRRQHVSFQETASGGSEAGFVDWCGQAPQCGSVEPRRVGSGRIWFGGGGGLRRAGLAFADSMARLTTTLRGLDSMARLASVWGGGAQDQPSPDDDDDDD